MPRINVTEGLEEEKDLTSSYFFRDQAEAEDVAQTMANLGIPFEIQCACIKDHKQDMCEDFMSSCRAGVYISTTTTYEPMISVIKNIVRENKNG